MARVRVFNQGLLDGLTQPDPEAAAAAPPPLWKEEEAAALAPYRKARQQQKVHLKDLEDLRARRYERNRRDALAKAAESDRRVREHININKARVEESYQKNFSSIMAGKELASTIKKQQDLEDQAEHNKKVRQFEEWNLEVYGKIQGRVAEQLEQTSADDITRKRNAEFQKFLDTTNAKGSVFRDIFTESEYDPLAPNRTCIKVASGDLRDPTSRVLDKLRDEKYMLASKAALTAAKQAHTRDVLDVLDWGSGRIESTPHGFFAKMMAKADVAATSGAPKEASGTFKSVIPFDHYNVSRGKAAVDVEMPKGKRIIPHIN